MDSVELLVEIEDFFEIAITSEEAEIIETVDDFHQCISLKLANKKRFNANLPHYNSADIYTLLKKIIHQKLGIPLHKITSTAIISKDLGID